MILSAEVLNNPPDVRHIRERSRFGETRETYQSRDLYGFNLFTFACEVVLDGIRYGVRPGMASIMPPGTERIFLFSGEESPHRVLHVLLPPGNAPSPCMVDLGADTSFALQLFETAEAAVETNSSEATASVWSLLWLLSRKEPLNPEASYLPPALRKALVFLEASIADPISVTDLAEAADLSPVHLSRLFRQHLNAGPATYLRTLRLTRAKTLLETTDEPVKRIAAEVGIPDPQHFNKLVRKQFNASPTQLRNRLRNR